MKRPLCIDLFCGLGGWTEGFLAEGYEVVGFDIERHQYESPASVNGIVCGSILQEYPAQLVLQDVLTLHGSQFRNAACIVASPPCQEYSYMAMPWKRAKAKAAAIRADKSGAALAKLNALFGACFRIQREACEAAGHHIPLVVENVKGAQPWVGPAAWHYGSFYLWGNVPALMPFTFRAVKLSGLANGTFPGGGLAQGYLDKQSGRKVPNMNFHEHEKTGKPGRSFQSAAVDHTKNNGGSWFNIGSPGQKETGRNPVHEGCKINGPERPQFKDGEFGWHARKMADGHSGSAKRKAASAQIAKIPLQLARWIARVYKPEHCMEATA